MNIFRVILVTSALAMVPPAQGDSASSVFLDSLGEVTVNGTFVGLPCDRTDFVSASFLPALESTEIRLEFVDLGAACPVPPSEDQYVYLMSADSGPGHVSVWIDTYDGEAWAAVTYGMPGGWPQFYYVPVAKTSTTYTFSLPYTDFSHAYFLSSEPYACMCGSTLWGTVYGDRLPDEGYIKAS